MRILHVVASYLPAMRYGGTIVSVHALCRALAERGHDVHVYTTSVDGHGDSPVPHDTPVDIDGVTVWYFQSRHARRLYWAPALRRRLRAHVDGFAVVHTHAVYLWPLWTAARAAHRAEVPYVVSPRGMLEKALIDAKSPLLKAGLIGLFEKRTLEQAAAVHVTSGREAHELRAFGFELSAVCEIPNGVDLEHCEGQRPSEAVETLIAGGPFVLFLGRISWKKGLDRLLRALRHAPGVRLVIAGHDDEQYRTTLDSIAAAEGIGDRIVFAGPVAGADKTALLRHAAFLVLPSYSENFGNVVLESFAAGRPVVVTPEVGVADLVEASAAGVVVAGDPVALGGALARLSNDAHLREAMAARAPDVAQRFSWPSVAARMEALYEHVAEGRRPPC